MTSDLGHGQAPPVLDDPVAVVDGPDETAPGRLRRMVAGVAKLRRYSGGTTGMVLVTFVVLACVIGPFIYSASPLQQHYDAILAPPSAEFPLGTDDVGRDQLARVLAGGRVTLLITVLSVAVAAPIGIAFGLLAGYVRGWTSSILATVLDAFLAFPFIVLALAITASLGAGTRTLVIAFSIVLVPLFARIARGEALSLRERTYVEAARAGGVGAPRIVWRHILPNMVGPLIVQGSLALAFVILAEAGLSFLGAGVQPPTAAWGSMLRRGVPLMEQSAWVVIVPGAAIALTVLGLNRLGDALREAFDPQVQPMPTRKMRRSQESFGLGSVALPDADPEPGSSEAAAFELIHGTNQPSREVRNDD